MFNNTLYVDNAYFTHFCDVFFADDEIPVQEETKVAAITEKKKKRVKRLVSKMYTTEDGSLGIYYVACLLRPVPF